MHSTKIPVLIFVLTALAVSTCLADETTSGLAFLRIGVGARASGMGEAFVAVSDDASATFWNPAGLSHIESTEIMFVNNSFIQDISQDYVAVVTSFGDLKMGGSFNFVNLGVLEKRDEAGTFYYEFKPFDLAASFSAAYPVLDWVSVGGTVKGVMEDIDTETAYGALFDAGVIAKLPVEGLSVGGVVQNIGPNIKFSEGDVPFDAPRTIRSGVSYVRGLDALSSRIGLALDIVSPMDDDLQVNVGGEWNYNALVTGRMGYRGGADTQGITTGFGVNYRGFIVDYAYVPFSEYLGNTHRIGVSYRFR